MDEPEFDPEKEKKRLDDLGQRIEHDRAEIDDEDPETEHRPTYADVRYGEGEDNQEDETIAPG